MAASPVKFPVNPQGSWLSDGGSGKNKFRIPEIGNYPLFLALKKLQTLAFLTFQPEGPFHFECGQTLEGLRIAYHVYGQLSPKGDNVIWICHALTANSDAADWWGALLGPGKAFDPSRDFIVCANILGSCYGTTGPASPNPESGRPYGLDFPAVTVRDMVHAHQLLREHLGISRIRILAGGSLGGYQALEWAVMEPGCIGKLLLLTTSARESAWGIAIHTTQRLAIEADSTWKGEGPESGGAGLMAARAIGMLTYRNYETYVRTQTDPDPGKLDGYRASSYILHQGEKLIRRFHAQCYWLLTKSMDSHHLARGRNLTVPEVLATILQPALVIAITSDILCPPAEQQILTRHMPQSRYCEIQSAYGHDGFLIEGELINSLFKAWDS